MAASKYFRVVVILFALFGAYTLTSKSVKYFMAKQEVKVPLTLLNGFNTTMNNYNENLNSRLWELDHLFTRDRYDDSMKVYTWKVKYDAVSVIIDSLVNEINGDIAIIKKKKLVNSPTADEFFRDTTTLAAIDDMKDYKNTNVVEEYMIKEGRATKLYNMIVSARERILKAVAPDERKKFEVKLPLTTLNTADWVNSYFRAVPLVEEVAFMNNLILVAKQSKLDMIDYFYEKCYHITCGPTSWLVPKVIAPTSFVLQGQDYTADIFVTPFTASLTPGTSVGLHKYSGAVIIPNPDGMPEYYPFESEYTVGERCK